MDRPPLTASLSPAEFRAYYWLKEELVAFCRENGLPTSGPKLDIADRIAAFLMDGTILRPAPLPIRKGAMPTTFSRETVIGDGWRCTRSLREWFESEVGRGFRFTGPVREILHNGQGRTLGEAADLWRETHTQKSERIAPQLEYNRHMRTYFENHPGATREDALAAWWEARSRRR
ncbi:MAG: DUF6434 domain-containing protein [Bacteroidota bacterium]